MHLPDERVTSQGRKEGRRRKDGRKEGENLKERERERKKEGTATEREGESVTLTTVSSLELIQESVSCCLLRPLLTTRTQEVPLSDKSYNEILHYTLMRNF